jgi:hypothetical protein
MLCGKLVIERLVEAEQTCAGKPFNHLHFVFIIQIT